MKTNIKFQKYGILIGAGIGIATAFALMCIFACVLLYAGVDRAYAPLFATVSVSAGAFASSVYAGKRVDLRGYLAGAITGVSYFAVVTILSLFIGNGDFSSNTLFHFIIILLSGMVGGIFGANKKSKNKFGNKYR